MPTFLHQGAWHSLIAAYLFLGGLGGGVVALGALHDLFLQPNTEQADRQPATFSVLTGLASLALGSLFLLLDLEQPLKAIYALSNPRSWITWGVIFILLYMLTGALYVWPYLRRRKVTTGFQRSMGVSAAVFGLLVAIYTGFLLAGSTGIPFWNTPALPLLFMVSGLSTGAALLMLYLLVVRTAFAGQVLHRLERIDLVLVLLELLILFGFINMAWYGNAANKLSAGFLLGSVGFLLGVPLVGLLLPLFLQVFSLRRHTASASVVASLCVLAGGALLRIYVLQAGIWAYPWPR